MLAVVPNAAGIDPAPPLTYPQTQRDFHSLTVPQIEALLNFYQVRYQARARRHDKLQLLGGYLGLAGYIV